MTTDMRDTAPRGVGERLQRSRFTVPVFADLMGITFLFVEGHAGDWRGGLISLAVMAVFSGLFLFGGRSETIRGLRGDGRDERIAMIDMRATAFAGVSVILALLVGFTVELGRGHDGAPYSWLCAIGGLAYIGAILVQRFRA